MSKKIRILSLFVKLCGNNNLSDKDPSLLIFCIKIKNLISEAVFSRFLNSSGNAFVGSWKLKKAVDMKSAVVICFAIVATVAVVADIPSTQENAVNHLKSF